ncbi:Ras-related protein Rab-13 [Nosema bombycis CQ1]|uniref:Ras-related protein Rab-13 n=1 Tax=Nosema bombycis (strain CQ1 / CVCC 102059) TaxID=578461 RepID=R0M7T4_NOSB1|nr:Ras-related protein Rab-13 [Nosema bombycis CQ1]|eukprot:EOB14054.1 Ras-related protein Rab-13 [Nosema bombycis CQ1]
MTSTKIDYRFKIIILGESNVGKTCLLRKYKNDEFQDSIMSTIGIDTVSKRIFVEDKNIMLNIWDTAGQERFFSITKSYYRNADGILLIFDLNDIKSFTSVDRWYKIIKEETENTPLFLIGNKKDLLSEKEYKEKEMDFLIKSKNLNTKFYPTSAKNGLNVSKIFEDMAKILISEGKEKVNKPEIVRVKKGDKMKRRYCC